MNSKTIAARPAILIVDDILNNVEAIGEILADDYDVQFATSALKGLELIRRSLPDLILLDVMMPEMDGYAMFAELQRNPATAGIPVIFVTAQNDSDSEIKALDVGAVDFISKPIIPKIVRRRVRTHLALRQRELQNQQLNEELERRVTERTLQVEALNAALAERAQQAEAAVNAKSLFIGNMSHELRTPMTAILGFTELLQKEINVPTCLRKLDHVFKAAKHLSATINQILDFTQIEAGAVTEAATEFSLRQIFEHIEEIALERAAAKNLHYQSDIDPAIPTQLLGDGEKIEQVLMNLTSNAFKFTQTGSISLTATLRQQANEQVSIRLAVKDTGIGIEASKLEQIFKPFEQADNSFTREYGGVGLGLSINRKLIEMLGGDMGVETDVGKGSQFWIDVSLRQSRQSALSSVRTTALAVLQALETKPRVLIVDDDFFNQSIFSMLLEQAELPFTVANDGLDAVAKVMVEDFSLILMDVQMPLMNGLDATRTIRRLPGKQHIPIIAISANAFAEDKARCFAAGMNAFLAKPVAAKVLYHEICQQLKLAM